MNLEDLTAQLLYTTVPIAVETREGQVKNATGFMLNLPTAQDRYGFPVLVTAKHVFDDVKRAQVVIHAREDDAPVVGRTYRIEILKPALEFSRSDAERDVFMLPIGKPVNDLHQQGKPTFFKAIDKSIVPDDERLRTLNALEDIIFIGYPSGMIDEVNAIPIMRRGITATPIWLDYCGQNVFLLDAGVYPGSSGSPVFIVNQGSYPDRGGLILGNRIWFVGMLTSADTSAVSTDFNFFTGLGSAINGSWVFQFAKEAFSDLLAGLTGRSFVDTAASD